jgi:hypothetical protein
VLVAVFSIATAARSRNLAILPWRPLVFLIIHLGAGIGLLT